MHDGRITAGRIIFDRLPFALARGHATPPRPDGLASATTLAEASGERFGSTCDAHGACATKDDPVRASPGRRQRLTYNQMVVEVLDPDTVDRMFAALADRTRRDIVTRVLQHEESVSSLAQRYEMSFAAVQKHVAVLERARLVTKQVHGRERLVRGNVDTIRAAARLLDQYEEIWHGRLARIDALLTDPSEGDPA